MAKIDELTFGSMVVEGKKHRRDVLIFSDGMVERRKAGPEKEPKFTGSAILWCRNHTK